MSYLQNNAHGSGDMGETELTLCGWQAGWLQESQPKPSLGVCLRGCSRTSKCTDRETFKSIMSRRGSGCGGVWGWGRGWGGQRAKGGDMAKQLQEGKEERVGESEQSREARLFIVGVVHLVSSPIFQISQQAS